MSYMEKSERHNKDKEKEDLEFDKLVDKIFKEHRKVIDGLAKH